MSYKRWDIYFAMAPHFENPNISTRHPVMIWNENTAFLIAFKMTSTDRGNEGKEYRLQEWKAAGLDHETSIRLIMPVRIDKSQIREYVGTIQSIDRFKIEEKLINGK